MVLSNCETLTPKAPYFTCHLKHRCSGKVSCTHLEEPPLMSCSALAIERVEGRDSRRWTWVGHATHLDGLHLVLPRDAAQKGPESVAQFRRDHGVTLFGAKDAMEIGADVRHATDSAAPSGLKAMRNLRPQR